MLWQRWRARWWGAMCYPFLCVNPPVCSLSSPSVCLPVVCLFIWLLTPVSPMSPSWQRECNGSMALSSPIQLPCPELHVTSWESKSVRWSMYESKIIYHHVFITLSLYMWAVYSEVSSLSLFFCNCVDAAPGEERRHSRIPEAPRGRCEGFECPESARMWFFTAAEAGE